MKGLKRNRDVADGDANAMDVDVKEVTALDTPKRSKVAV
jgi:hypothetical protein